MLNQGHSCPGSGGSGWASEQTGLVRAWWRLTEVSVRAATLAAEAIAPAVNSQGSVVQTEMAGPAVAVGGGRTGRLWEWRRLNWGFRASLGGEGI